MTRLERLLELRGRIDQEIRRERRTHRVVGQIEAEVERMHITPHQRTVRAERLLQASADYYGVRVAYLSSNRRTKAATEARMVAAWAIRTSLGMSYPEIGRLIAKDHTTVMYATKKVEKDVELRTVGSRLLRTVEERAA